MKGKVLVTEKEATHKEAIDLLASNGFSINYTTPEELPINSKLADAEVLVVNVYTEIGKNVLDAAKNLKAIIACCAGIDKIDAGECKRRGIKIYNSPSTNANAVAEHMIALMLSVLRKLLQADKTVRNGGWERKKFMSYELEGKTIGIVGFGAIGKLVAKKLSGFGVNILVYDPFLTKEQIEGVEGVKAKMISKLNELLKTSDIITIHVPLSEKTKYLIDKKEFELMKRAAILINTSRGAIVSENALVEALKNRKIYGAGIDVFENEPPSGSELLKLENVVLTPHIATMTEEAFRRMSMQAVEKFLEEFRK